MANQHIEWLLEGVEAWNARREREPFTPNLSETDFSKSGELWERFVAASMTSDRGLLLRGVDFTGAQIHETNFVGADLREAKLDGVMFFEAILDKADFRGATFQETVLYSARLSEANIRSVNSGTYTGEEQTVFRTDLSSVRYLTQRQLDTMVGDRGVILPDGLSYPDHWPEPERPEYPGKQPELPERAVSTPVSENEGQLRLARIAPPDRSDLETIHGDLREDLGSLVSSGSLDNISKGLDAALKRFATIANCAYDSLDQVRFGVQANALRLRLDAYRPEIADVAPEKLGDLDAVLLSAELLASRLPEWQIFLAESRDTRDPVEENAEAVAEAVAEAGAAMENDPAHFDAALSERLTEYLNTATTEAYLAGVALLNDIAFTTFREVSRLIRDTGSEARKFAIKGLAGGVVTGLGSSLAKLAGIVPAELEWVLPWLQYIPTILG